MSCCPLGLVRRPMGFGLLVIVLAFAHGGAREALASFNNMEEERVPRDFMIGVASAAYQIEGAWNEDGKGPSICDEYFHNRPSMANGDVACDSYHKYKEDVQRVKSLKLDFYRISLSWARLLPDGTTDNINQAGVDFYNSFIDEIVKHGIKPVVTLYHWDLPQALEVKAGGWGGDASIQDYYLEYAKFAFKTFGDRVKWWITFNEPHQFCSEGYETGDMAPGIVDPGVGLYKCGHNLILAHAKAYRAYQQYFSHQEGRVGITLGLDIYYAPQNESSVADQEAAERAILFEFGWFSDPVLFGNYPEVMRETIDANSKAEGRAVSRLPPFTDQEKEMLRGSADFLGVNHYISLLATPGIPDGAGNPSYERDIAVVTSQKSEWSVGNCFSQNTSWGIRESLNWVKNRYKNFPTFVTENGYCGDGSEGLQDYNRISFISAFLRATLRAVNEDGCKVLGYAFWSLTDDFEWSSGFQKKFGVYRIDFENDPDLRRIPKESSKYLREIMETRRVKYYPFNKN